MASKSQEKALVELRKHCPEIFKDGQIDFHLLSEKYGQRPNHYEMFWNGKYESKESLKNPSLGCLRPVVGDSVNWDTTENVFIEGDNLEVLKLMRKAYKGSVKCIYIDPPYNTGNDFVYKDNFKNGVEAYLEATNQVGNSNIETDGRFHTNWLNMIYPRLLVAKELLREDGCIFISMDDSEVGNLRKVCDEVFGESNFVGHMIWERNTGGVKSKKFGVNHDFILVYAKNISKWDRLLLPRNEEQLGRYKNVDDDPRGVWLGDNITCQSPTPYNYEIVNPSGVKFMPPKGRYWTYSPETWQKLVSENRIYWGTKPESQPKYKRFLTDVQDGVDPQSILHMSEVGGSTSGTKELKDLFPKDGKVFSYPKPTGLIKHLLKICTKKDDIVLDFFAGSGTTAHAVMSLNAEDGGNRKWICVQLPEKLDSSIDTQKPTIEFLNSIKKPLRISEVTKERIRRASKKVQDENPDYKGDLGFRVFKLDKSNFKKRYEPNKDGVDERTPQQKWKDSLNAIKADHQMLDVFFEQALNDGISLSVGYKQHDVGGVKIFQANTNQIILTTDGFPFARAKDVSVAIVKMKRALEKSGAKGVPNVYFYGAALRSDPKTWLQIHTVLSQFDVAFNQL